MSVQSCKGCGGLFAFLPRGLCAACIDVREEKFHAVRDYLRDNRGASVMAACTATDVEERLIAEFIREGRLEFAVESSESLADQRAREELRARIAAQVTARPAAPTSAPAPGSAPAAPAPRRSGMKSRLS